MISRLRLLVGVSVHNWSEGQKLGPVQKPETARTNTEVSRTAVKRAIRREFVAEFFELCARGKFFAVITDSALALTEFDSYRL